MRIYLTYSFNDCSTLRVYSSLQEAEAQQSENLVSIPITSKVDQIYLEFKNLGSSYEVDFYFTLQEALAQRCDESLLFGYKLHESRWSRVI